MYRDDQPPAHTPWLFGSFFLGGFECSTHRTTEGDRLDSVAVSQHDHQASADYALCRAAGIRAVREAARWPIIDRGGAVDLEDVRRLARLGQAAELTQIWDLMHYGYPDDLDPFEEPESFIARFAAYVRMVATMVRAETTGSTYYTPINEISYFAWAAGEVGYMAPFGQGRGAELKRTLVRASIAATNALWEVDPGARIVNVDPLVRLHAPAGRPDLQAEADHFNQHVVTEGFDLLAGRREPALGGSRAHLGIVALNYYSYNQWTMPTPQSPQRFLDAHDPRWASLSDLLHELHSRYGGPLLIGETGAPADERPGWLRHLAQEAQRALALGVDLQGICWYPIVTTPDWEDTTAFFDGGLFDIVPQSDGRLARVPSRPALSALRAAQTVLDRENLPKEPLEPAAPARLVPAVQVIQPLALARSKADNFSCQTLVTGASLLAQLYSFGSGAWVGAHQHPATEHILTVLAGAARVGIGERWLSLSQGHTLLVPAAVYHSIHNDGTEPLVVQQVSAPKPWDARFQGPAPTPERYPGSETQ